MDSKLRILSIVDDLFSRAYANDDSFEETMEYVNDTAHYLKQGETEFEKELGKMIQDKIDEIVKENDLCPDCFSKTESRLLYSATYIDPAEYITECTNCEWYQ